MRLLIIFGWLVAAAAATAQPSSTGIRKVSYLSSTNLGAATTVATQGLQTFRKLITAKNFVGLGFKSTNEVAQTQLGEAIIIYKVRLDYLRSYHTNASLTNLFVQFNKVIFPVSVGPEVRTSLTLAKIDDRWSTRSFGGSALISLLTKSRKEVSNTTGLPLASFFALEVPALNLYFIAHYHGEQLMLTSILDESSLNISAGKTLSAEEVFAVLAPAARRRNDLPG